MTQDTQVQINAGNYVSVHKLCDSLGITTEEFSKQYENLSDEEKETIRILKEKTELRVHHLDIGKTLILLSGLAEN